MVAVDVVGVVDPTVDATARVLAVVDDERASSERPSSFSASASAPPIAAAATTTNAMTIQRRVTPSSQVDRADLLSAPRRGAVARRSTRVGYIPVIDADLSLALDLADEADQITMERFRARDLRVDTKPDRTPVTEADHAVESRLRDRLALARPADAVLGEEAGVSGTSSGDPPGVADRRWVIDPIDGTKGYARGIPVWATLVSLECGGVPTVGVVSAPALGSRWWAARGEGAWRDGASVSVSGVGDLRDAHLAYDSVRDFEVAGLGEQFLSLARTCRRSRGFGDFWSHVLVADGSIDVAIEVGGLAVWDLSPLLVLVEEAGGRFTDLGGAARADGGDAVSTNGLLHEAVLAALRT